MTPRESTQRSILSSGGSGILRIRVICTELPGKRFEDLAGTVCEPVHLGIQKGRTVIEDVPGDRKRVVFEPTFKVREIAGGNTDFGGPFAQGRPGERFFYLSWGVKKPGGEFEMFRRLKIPLGHLKWKGVEAALEADRPIEVTLRLTDTRGGPLCATPKADFIRWEGEKGRT